MEEQSMLNEQEQEIWEHCNILHDGQKCGATYEETMCLLSTIKQLREQAKEHEEVIAHQGNSIIRRTEKNVKR